MVHEQNIHKKIELKLNRQYSQYQKQLSTIQDKIDKLKKQKTRLLHLLADEVILESDYREAIAQNMSEVTTLSDQMHALQEKLSSYNLQEDIHRIQHALKDLDHLEELTPELLHRLIERIEIKENGTARIFYRFSLPDQLFTA